MEGGSVTAWRTIPSWPAYEASDDGTIRRASTKRPLRRVHRRGVACVRVRTPDRKHASRIPVHALLCEAFHGPRPTPQHRAWVLDGKRSRLVPGNVAWLTQAERWASALAAPGLKGARLTEATARQILSLDGLASGVEVAAAYGVDSSLVRRIWSRDGWRHVRPPTRDDLDEAAARVGLEEALTR